MRLSTRSHVILLALTLLNLAILGMIAVREQAFAAATSAAGILRGRGLEIVDEAGAVRASIMIHPAARQPDGSLYPETVLLRLVTAQGRPIVKISSSEDGAGMVLSASEGPAYVQILSRQRKPRIMVVDDDARTLATLP